MVEQLHRSIFIVLGLRVAEGLRERFATCWCTSQIGLIRSLYSARRCRSLSVRNSASGSNSWSNNKKNVRSSSNYNMFLNFCLFLPVQSDIYRSDIFCICASIIRNCPAVTATNGRRFITIIWPPNGWSKIHNEYNSMILTY